MTEYLYDKENPKSPLRNKPQGWESFYLGMPNHFERTEMITRRLMKDYDGDLSKFSLEIRKPHDRGQRWRTLKNLAAWARNPIGRFAWRLTYTANYNRFPSPWYMVTGACVTSIVLQMAYKASSIFFI